MSDEQPPYLHVAAILSWYYWCPEARAARERTETEQRERVERFRTALARVFGEKLNPRITTNGGCLEIEVEGLRLLAYEATSSQKTETRTMVALIGRCPSCGVETPSEPFVTLAGLGKQLEQFEPIYEHFCLFRRRAQQMNESR